MDVLGRWLEELLAIPIAAKEDTATNAAASRYLAPGGQGTAVVGPQEPQTLELGIMLPQETKKSQNITTKYQK